MRRKWLTPLIFAVILPVAIIAIAVFSGQSSTVDSFDPLDPPWPTPTPALSDWLTPGMAVHHVAVEPIQIKRVPATKITLPRSQNRSLLKPTADGGCIAVSQVLVNEKNTSGNAPSMLRAIRFKSDGSVLWDRRYDSDPFSGYAVSLCVWPDGGFAVSVRVSTTVSGQTESMDRLFRFSPDGTKRWQSDSGTALSGTYNFLFAVSDNSLIAAGSIVQPGPDGSMTDNEVNLLHYDKDGQLAGQKEIGGVGYQMLSDAAFSAETGLVLTWQSEPSAGSAASGGVVQRRSMVSCFDANLQESWTAEIPGQMSVLSILSQCADGGILLSGSKMASEGTAFGDTSRSVILQINRQGSRDWTIDSGAGEWFLQAAELKDGRLIVGSFATGSDSGDLTRLMVLSGTGQMTTVLPETPGIVEQLVPTEDGGLTAVFRQSVRPIPQPPYISSLWIDTEVIVAHYDSSLQLRWRRTIDQYKYELRTDLVVPTVKDRLLVG